MLTHQAATTLREAVNEMPRLERDVSEAPSIYRTLETHTVATSNTTKREIIPQWSTKLNRSMIQGYLFDQQS